MATKINYVLKQKENSRYYIPSNGSQVIDVVSDMAWTLTPTSVREQYNNRVPAMELIEYQQSTGQLIASLLYFLRVAERLFITDNANTGVINADTDPSEVYKMKYFGEPTGFKYRLPYFNPAHTKRNNTFGGDESPFDGFQNLLSTAASIPKAMIGSNDKLYSNFHRAGLVSSSISLAKGVTESMIPGKIKFEFPQAWDSTSPETYSTTFDLFNTGDYDQLIQNRRLCHLLSYQNSPSRRNFAIMDPPVIYSLHIPGVVNLPVCYVNDLTITNLGNTRMMYVDGIEAVIPEAYRISLNFQSLLLPTKNIMLAVEKGQTVSSVSSLPEFTEQLRRWTNELLTSPNEGVQQDAVLTREPFSNLTSLTT